MNKPQLIAQAEALNRRARELWQESTALTVAEYEALGLDTSRIGPDYVCAAGAPLRAESTALRAKAKQLFEQANGNAASPLAVTNSVEAAQVDPAIDAIVKAAVANMFSSGARTTAPQSAETAAEIAVREAEAQAVEADQLVARIVGDPSLVARYAAEREAQRAEARAAATGGSADARNAEIDDTVARILAA